MFYSHQLLARKAPLGQIWMAATMHSKINRRKLNKLNIIKICEEILNPSIPMALRLSGILMGGVVIVYERKVKLLFDDVSRLLVEINEAWKVKSAPDPTMLPKGKSQAKKGTITMPEKEEMALGDIEQSLQFSNATATMGFQQTAYFTMRLDAVEEPNIGNGGREDEDPLDNLHQADVENITLFESFQANVDPHNRFERFDIEGDDETQVNVTSGDYNQIPSILIPSPPPPDDPKRDDLTQDQPPEHPISQLPNDDIQARHQEHKRRGPTKRKRGKPVAITMDCEQTMIPAHIYQRWLQSASDLVSRRGRKKKGTDIMSSTKIVDLMKLPPVTLMGDLYSSVNRDIYYPAPLLDLWIKSTQPPHDSPSATRISTQYPPEPSASSPPGVPNTNDDFTGFHFEDFDSRLDNLFNAPVETGRAPIFDNGFRVPEATPHVSSGKSDTIPGVDTAFSIPSTVSEHGLSSHSDFEKGRIRKRRYSSSGNSSGGLQPVAENENFRNVNFKLSRLSDIGPTPDQELLVETGPTQTQGKTNHPSDKITDSILAQMRAHFDTPGAPQFESLDILAAGMTRKSAAQLFYQTCVLATRDALRVEQKAPYGEILIFRGSKM
ncbi:sister chromatid cohesion 1 protein 1 [Cicer arietinum]|uniref:sister chromatid cohesion 1 protein 1 n=1 Tax=Cicer arietinum TaxID=3827 RepID=UPI003CC5A658